MRTLHVSRVGSLVRRDNSTLVVEHGGEVVTREPIADLGRLLVWGGVEVTTAALRMLLRSGVHVALLTQRGRYVGAVVPPLDGAVALRLAQTRRYGDPEFGLALSRRLVADKLFAQALVLREAPRSLNLRSDLGAIRRIEEHLRDVDTAGDLDTLRGLEGIAARTYFDAWKSLIPEPFHFDGRNRRPPRDPVNALLSLGYTLLGIEVAGDLEARGLDPRLGFLHTLRAGRPALALDLLDPWRPATVDRLVVRVLRRREIRPEHFREEGGGVRLTRDALRTFIAAYDRHLGPRDGEGLRHRIAAYVDGVEQLIVSGRTPDESLPALDADLGAGAGEGGVPALERE